MPSESQIARTIQVLELRLLDPAVRSSPAELDRLLADDFVEIGGSGRKFNKAAIIESLKGEVDALLTLQEFRLKLLGPTVAHATYRVVARTGGGERATLRSSLWTLQEGSWKLVFHQGTPSTPEVTGFETKRLPAEATGTAPDGSDVRVLLGLGGGGMAHFQLAPGRVSLAVTHRTVEEIWFVVSGQGQMWRKQAGREGTVDLEPGVCLTIPLGTHFQFRASESAALSAVGVTMPPWPGSEEAIVVPGPWSPK